METGPAHQELLSDVSSLAGTTLGGRYKLLTAVGPRLTTFDYVAQDTASSETNRVLLKVLPSLLAIDGQLISAIQDGIASTQVITHERVDCATAIIRGDDATFTVQPWREGVTLDAVLEKAGELPADDVVALLEPVADALDVAAALGVMHGDVRPENVLITADGKAYMSSFVVSRLLIDRLIDLNPDALMHAIPWMAPETCEGAAPARPQDIYGLGICMYAALSGHAPFSEDEVHDKLGIEPPPALTNVRTPLGDNVMSALAPTPDQRPRSCHAVMRRTAPGSPPASKPPAVSGMKGDEANAATGAAFNAAVAKAATDSTTYAQREYQRERELAGIEDKPEPDTNRIAMYGAFAVGIAVLAIAGGALYGVMSSGSRPGNPVVTSTTNTNPTGSGTTVQPNGVDATTSTNGDDPLESPDATPVDPTPDEPDSTNNVDPPDRTDRDPRDPAAITRDPPRNPPRQNGSGTIGSTSSGTNGQDAPPPEPEIKLTRTERKIEALLDNRFATLSIKPAEKAVLGEPVTTRLDSDHGVWEDLPRNLKGMLFTPTQESGKIEFKAVTAGQVFLAVYQRDWGDRDESGYAWKQELVTILDLEADGWHRVADFGTFEWALYVRDLNRGESFVMRTKKYIAPIIIFPPEAMPIELRSEGNS